MKFHQSLRTRLSLWIALLATFVTLAGAFASLYLGYRFLEKNFEDNIRSHMILASISLIQPVKHINYLELREQIEAIISYDAIQGVAVYDQNQNLLMQSGDMDGQLLSTDIGAEPDVQGKIDVFFSTKSLRDGFTYILGIGAVILLLFLPLFVFAVWRVCHIYLFDLFKLTECINKTSCQELPQYPGIMRKDEVGLLSQAMQHRDEELGNYHEELENYKNHLENLVEQRTRELRRSEMLSKTILNSMPESIALVDTSDFTILDANQAFLDKHNQTLSQVLGRPCYEITHGLNQPCRGRKHFCPIQEYLSSGRPFVAEHEHSSDKGMTQYVEVSAWPVFDENNNPVQMVHVERDITEEKRIERLREDVERIVRHDLKTPLNGIIGLSDLLLDDPELGPEQKDFARHIHESGQRMLNMINHSLDLFKMEEGTYNLVPERFDLLKVMRVLKKEAARYSKPKNLEIAVKVNGTEISDSDSLEVYLEQRHILAMLSNLLTNALEAAPEGTTVSVDIIPQEENLNIDIHNQGTVPEEIRDRFFERYTTAGKTRGTGLGTFSARLMARAHHGDITFSTSREEGTHLYVRLPRLQEA
ncbi:MAG: PAS domain-containing sensor histidine kinase [Desulfonatronovibrionaceae bacterium]